MNIDIQTQESKPHLDREEITADVTFSGATPSRDAVRDQLASEVQALQESVLVRQIDPTYGSSTARVHAVVYDDDADIEAIEQRYMVERNTTEAAEDQAEADEAGEDAEEA